MNPENDVFHIARNLLAQHSGLPRPTAAECVKALRDYALEQNVDELELATRIAGSRPEVLKKGRFCSAGGELCALIDWLEAKRWRHEAPTAPGLYTWRLCHTWEPIEREVRYGTENDSHPGQLGAFSSRVGKWVPLPQLVARNNGGQWLVADIVRHAPRVVKTIPLKEGIFHETN